MRYSTTGANKWDNAQPVTHTRGEDIVALGHNGNLTNTGELRAEMELAGVDLRASTDSEIIAAMIAAEEGSLLAAVCNVMPRLVGAYSVVAMTSRELVAFRDPHGVRPLVLGRLDDDGWCVASETCALDQIGARFERDVRPGEAVRLTADGVESRQAMPSAGGAAVRVRAHLLRPPGQPDGRHDGVAVPPGDGRRARPREPGRGRPGGGPARQRHPGGHRLRRTSRASPTPRRSCATATSGRSFIQPDQALRQHGIRLKFNPLPAVIRGKRLVVVDDSIVRGNTTRQIVAMLLDAGATEVHMRISSPPILWPCFYGIDMADRSELVAARRQRGGDRRADRRPLAGLPVARTACSAPSAGPPSSFCRACFTGEYPIPIPDSSLKLRFEPGAREPLRA